MTPRELLMTCNRDELVSAIASRNRSKFSCLPVVDDDGRYIGLFHAERWFDIDAPEIPVGEDFEAFSEDLVIGSDASIYEFVVQADMRPTRLVVSGDSVAGLVSISDLQQLPVRASLFTLVTALEMTMARRIELEWCDNVGEWKSLLSPDRQEKLQEMIDDAHQADRYINDITLTQFCDKATIIRKAQIVDGNNKELKRKFRDTEELRNSLAHATFYAETPETASDACATVRTILQLKRALLDGIAELQTAAAHEP